ncbi:hypothetical protein Pla22_07970 [Rubripirellula amarantea]|uniref:Thioredoxin domain-containing protein n=1 Tax=Rubripirellula amarantea TaxID=2527999 RepID=A0A5C5WSN5_9BACT|nr:SCO family protein [Rubripirellula amarantea]TWT53169.1 hypothetical protein Pla22_07970 [Rubripirellula amarantea]
MKTFINIVCILLVGLGIGLVVRSTRHSSTTPSGLAPDDVVYTNTEAPGEKVEVVDVENPEPTHPPEDEAWLSRFELTERSGKLIKSEDLKGEPYIVSFFFSLCPSICVQQNQKIKELQDEFQGQGIKFVAISVDPENDTPERLQEYAARFGADEQQWLFLTGELNYIRRIGGEIFRQPVNKQFHTERFALVDADGEIEGFYNWPEEPQMEKLRVKIREMLQQKESK